MTRPTSSRGTLCTARIRATPSWSTRLMMPPSVSSNSTAPAITRCSRLSRSSSEEIDATTLRSVVASISSELDLDSPLHRVIAGAVELLDTEGGIISLVDQDGVARMRAVHNVPRELVGRVIEPGEGLIGQVLLTRQPLIVEHYGRDLPRPLPEGKPVRSGVAVPVWWHDRMVGVFGVLGRDPARVFNAED